MENNSNVNHYQNDFLLDKTSQTVTITRVFDAALEQVWNAFTTAEILDQWVAPKPFTSKTNKPTQSTTCRNAAIAVPAFRARCVSAGQKIERAQCRNCANADLLRTNGGGQITCHERTDLFGTSAFACSGLRHTRRDWT